MSEEYKNSWPECVGLTGEEAQQLILNEFPQIQTQILEVNSMVTMDYRTDRVRIFVNDQGIVVNEPSRG